MSLSSNCLPLGISSHCSQVANMFPHGKVPRGFSFDYGTVHKLRLLLAEGLRQAVIMGNLLTSGKLWQISSKEVECSGICGHECRQRHAPAGRPPIVNEVEFHFLARNVHWVPFLYSFSETSRNLIGALTKLSYSARGFREAKRNKWFGPGRPLLRR